MRCARLVIVAVMISTSIPRGVQGAFEMLPGPVPGGAAAWAWDPLGLRSERAGFRLEAMGGRPAALDELLWTRVTAGGPIRYARAGLEWDQLRLDSVYSEAVIGGWLGCGGFDLGLRRWERWTLGNLDAGGWSLTGGASLRIRGWRLELACVDRAICGAERGGPAERWGASVHCRLAPGLETSAGAATSRSGRIAEAGIRWSLLEQFTIDQRFRTPGSAFTTGVSVRVSRVGIGLWYEPHPALGSRIGLACGYR